MVRSTLENSRHLEALVKEHRDACDNGHREKFQFELSLIATLVDFNFGSSKADTLLGLCKFQLRVTVVDFNDILDIFKENHRHILM